MNQTGYSRVGLAMVVNMVPVAGVSEGIVAGLKATWASASDGAVDEAALAYAVQEYPLSNAELLASLEQCRPPHSWYEEDHEGLY